MTHRRFEAIRASRSKVVKIAFPISQFARIDSRESPRFALRLAGPSKLGKFWRGRRGQREISFKMFFFSQKIAVTCSSVQRRNEEKWKRRKQREPLKSLWSHLLLCVFEYLGASGSVGAYPGHNSQGAAKGCVIKGDVYKRK